MNYWVEGGITYKQEYNYENLLSAVKKMNGTCTGGTVLETTSFLYDGDGNLVKKTKPDGSKTIYVGGIYEVDKTSGGSVTRTVTYCPAGGAMRINITGGSNTLYYILKDHLGSASVVTDSSGTVVGEQRYYPYGETRFTSGTIYTDKLFTGQRDVGLGIYHYGARFYSPKTGRFLSPDTIIPGTANPQAYNRYSYVLGNPLKYTDPTGHMFASDDYTESDGICDSGDTSCNWVGTGNNGGSNDNDDNEDDDDGDAVSDTTPTPPVTVPTPTMSPPPCSSSMCNPNLTGPWPPVTAPPNPVISILGVATLLVLAVPEILIGLGMLSLLGAGPLGWAFDVFAMLPLEFAMINLSIYAAQMAATGSTDHDVLPLVPGDQ